MSNNIEKITSFYRLCNECQQNSNDYSISRVLMRHINDMGEMTLEILAEEAMISTSSISRFITKAGFKNFQEFKYILLECQGELFKARNKMQKITQSDVTTAEGIQRIQLMAEENINQTVSNIDVDALIEITKLLLKAKSVSIIGDVEEQTIFLPLQLDLISNGVPTFLYYSREVQKSHADHLTEGDVVLFIAIAEDFFTDVQKDFLRQAKKNKAMIIAFCQDESYLDNYVDRIIYYGIPKTILNGYYSLLLLASILTDMIYQI